MNPVDSLIGLCATCVFRREVPGARSTFYMCERSFSDARFARYPRLPVHRCGGYQPQSADSPQKADNPQNSQDLDNPQSSQNSQDLDNPQNSQDSQDLDDPQNSQNSQKTPQ
jgi:hypothetical protein